jgi:F-type H+-transporting ATPase subunit epsilon
MNVSILSPKGELYTGEAIAVTIPGINGSLGILDNHAPLISSLASGKIEIETTKGQKSYFEVKGGVVEVADNSVSLLCNNAEKL